MLSPNKFCSNWPKTMVLIWRSNRCAVISCTHHSQSPIDHAHAAMVLNAATTSKRDKPSLSPLIPDSIISNRTKIITDLRCDIVSPCRRCCMRYEICTDFRWGNDYDHRPVSYDSNMRTWASPNNSHEPTQYQYGTAPLRTQAICEW